MNIRTAIIRLLQFPLILGVIYLLTFLLTWVAPGSPFDQSDRRMDPAAEARLREQFHADSAWSFLSHYPMMALKGDLGPSMYYRGRSVSQILADAVPVSAALGFMAMSIAIVAGVVIGALAAVKRGGAFDALSLSVSLIGISLPSFVTAGVLLLVFCMFLQWFPVGEWTSLRGLLLPAVALAMLPMAYIARLTRVAMLDVLDSDFVRTARAKGLSRQRVIWRHCLPNAFLPVLSYLGPATASALTGSFVVEKVFNIPGLGRHLVNSVLNRDQTMILGTVMVYSVLLLVLNLLVDLAYAFFDPRIDLEGKQA